MYTKLSVLRSYFKLGKMKLGKLKVLYEFLPLIERSVIDRVFANSAIAIVLNFKASLLVAVTMGYVKLHRSYSHCWMQQQSFFIRWLMFFPSIVFEIMRHGGKKALLWGISRCFYSVTLATRLSPAWWALLRKAVLSHVVLETLKIWLNLFFDSG